MWQNDVLDDWTEGITEKITTDQWFQSPNKPFKDNYKWLTSPEVYIAVILNPPPQTVQCMVVNCQWMVMNIFYKCFSLFYFKCFVSRYVEVNFVWSRAVSLELDQQQSSSVCGQRGFKGSNKYCKSQSSQRLQAFIFWTCLVFSSSMPLTPKQEFDLEYYLEVLGCKTQQNMWTPHNKTKDNIL